MRYLILYEYDQRNRRLFADAVEKMNYTFMTLQLNNKENVYSDNTSANGVVFDLTPYFRDDEKAQAFSLIVENIVNTLDDEHNLFFIVDKRYTYNVKDNLFYKIKRVESFEKKIGIRVSDCNNIVDLKERAFEKVLQVLSDDLIGNDRFKLRLSEELRKYRIFNKLGYQPIFSMLLCGKSGIGKTEVARILHRSLSPEESFIKINFGNYSDQNALSSLIGSPRGYVGSSKGELSEKLNNSQSKVILIDEFEKSDKQVKNFFLQLLEDGVFTDSLGRDYDLNKYIIVFTANLPHDEVPNKLPKELISRISLRYALSPLSDIEKQMYVNKRAGAITQDVKQQLEIDISSRVQSLMSNLDVSKYENMRDINNEIMKRISVELYPLIWSTED